MENARKISLPKRALAVFLAVTLVVTLCPFAKSQAYATANLTEQENQTEQTQAEQETTQGNAQLTEDTDTSTEKVTITLSSANESSIILKYDDKEIKSGDSVEPGKELKVKLKNKASDNNIKIPKTIKVNDKNKSFTLDKSNWKSNFDNIAGASTTKSLGTVSSNTTVSVEYQTTAPVYRLYNTATSEHLFTTDKSEYDSWVDKFNRGEDCWQGEGIDWLAPKSGTAVYRLYNAGLGSMGHSSHFYTSDENERNKLKSQDGWVDDNNGNPMFYSGGDKAIFTAYNEALRSAHHYTSSLTEYKSLVKEGWDIETQRSMKNGKWTGCFKAVTSASSNEGDTDDWSGDIMIGAFTVSYDSNGGDWSNEMYYSNDGSLFYLGSTAFQDPLDGTHIFSRADGNDHYTMTCPSIIYYKGYFWMISSGGSWLNNGQASFVISCSKDFKKWSVPWGFTTSINGGTLGNNQVAPEWFLDEDTGKVYIIQSIGEYGEYSGAGATNDKMKPYICEVVGLDKDPNLNERVGLLYPDSLQGNLSFSNMSCMESVANAERGGTDDNLIDGCMYKEGGKYYLVIKNKGLYNDVFVSDNPMSDNWTKATPNAISYGYEAPSLVKFNNKYRLYLDGVPGTMPVGTAAQTSDTLLGGWSGVFTPRFINCANGQTIGSRHGSVFVLKKNSEGWKQLKESLSLS